MTGAGMGLCGILEVLNSDRTLDEILHYLVARACVLLGADACVLYRLDLDRGCVSVEATAGVALEMVAAGPETVDLPLAGPGGLGRAALNRLLAGDALIVYQSSDLEALAEAAERKGAVDPVGAWFRDLAHDYRSGMSVPLRIKEEVYGTLGLYYTAHDAVTDETERLAADFADQAALAIENAHLRVQAGRTAALQERGRLARDLHDSVTQSLYSLTLLAEAARRLTGAGDLAKVEEAIGRLGEIGQQALKEMRLLVYELRPSVLRREGLVRALAYRLETVEKRAGVETLFSVEGDLDPTPALEEQVYHVVQEALNNALKHASATAVSVRIVVDGGLRVEVEDNGVGFDVAQLDEASGIGLSTMRERVESLGGRLSLTSVPGHGTQVLIALPQTSGIARGSTEADDGQR